MEWVVTTGPSVEEAKDRALDQLGVAADEADFEVIEEPKTGLFGRLKVEAKVRARVRPTPVRPKQDRRPRGRGKQRAGSEGTRRSERDDRRGRTRNEAGDESGSSGHTPSQDVTPANRTDEPSNGSPRSRRGSRPRQGSRQKQEEQSEMSEVHSEVQSDVTPQEVGEAAVAFMDGLVAAFGAEASTELTVDGTDLDVRLQGSDLGLLVGPGGRTLTAVQDLVRVASQRRLGDHETRLRIDVAGYREKRREALERFAVAVANEVVASQTAKALEPMSSADRKTVHDAINDVNGVVSRSEGDDPYRRVVIAPA